MRSRRWCRLTALLASIAVVLSLAACGGDDDGGSGAPAATGDLPEGTCTEDAKFDPGQAHEDDATYSVDPPAGGPHDNTPLLPGMYLTSNPDEGRVVHALEHGDVVVWLKQKPTSNDSKKLESLALDYPKHVLVVVRPSMESPVAATAWHHRLLCTGLNIREIVKFVQTYRNKGPEGFVD